MNLSRLATLAVFFMMVMSAFVTVPTYNVGADEGGCMDYDDENGNGAYDEGEPCYDDDSGEGDPPGEGEGCMDYDDENGNGAYDVGEPCYDEECPFDADNLESPCNADVCADGNHESQECQDFVDNYCENYNEPGCHMDNGDNNIFGHLDFKIKMHSLSEWHVSGTGQSRTEDANYIRDDISAMCLMMGTTAIDGIIDDECFDHWVMMIESDDYKDDGYDEFRCPPDLTDDECSAFEACQNSMSMSCMRLFYDYCKDNPMCDDEGEECYDDEGNLEPCGPNIWHVLFAYEDGDLTAAEFLESNEMVEWFDDMNDGGAPTPEEAMEETDADGDGFMSLDEFDAMWNEEEDGDDLDWGAVEDLFDDSDTDGDGLLALDELQFFIDGIECMTSDFGDCYTDINHHHMGAYDVYTFSVDDDTAVEIHSNFENHDSPEFICGDGSTIEFYLVNNGNQDCEDGADEQWYDSNTPDDLSDDCQMHNNSDCVGEEVNWFDCHDGSEIWINQVNNDEYNCPDGDDEYHHENKGWYGHIYLLEGHHEAESSIFDEILDNDDIFESENSYCEWGNTDKTYVNCDYFINADLSQGDYTLVTVGDCHYEHDEDDVETLVCNNGHYNHTLVQDGEEDDMTNIQGDVHEDSPITDFAHKEEKDDIYGNFVAYDATTITIGSDGFTGTLSSFSFDCDENGDYCYGTHSNLYIYDTLFDSTEPESGLLSSANYHSYDGLSCPAVMVECGLTQIDVDLPEGDYTIVTTFHHEGEFINMLISEDNDDIVNEWNGDIHNAYYDYDDNNETILVSGSERAYMPYPEYKEWEPECYDDDGNVVDCEDMFGPMHLMFDIMENMTGYDDGTIEADDAANNMKDLMYKLFDMMSMFEDDGKDDDCDGDLDGDGITNCMDSDADGDGIPDKDQMADADGDGIPDMYEEMIDHLDPYNADSDGDGIMDIDDDDPALPEWAQDLANNDWQSDDDYEENFNCHKNWVDNGKPVWSSGWPHYDKKMTVEWPAGSGDLWYPEGGAITANEEPGLGHWWVCDGNYEGDDNPPSLDGILGVQDPEDWDCKPESTNVVGSIVQNEHLAIFCSFEFKITFEGADDTLDMHHLHIPFSSDEHWTVEFVLLDGYEILECKLDDIGELCEEMADGSFSGKGPAGVSMIKTVEEEPQPDCDYEIGLDSTGMAFDPIELKIKAGETVCWQWKNAEMEHNVLELEGEYDATMNITNINFGFSSGEPSATVDFRHTFTKDNMTHYYVCEPHASTGMVGKIVVGTPEATVVDEAIEEGLPSVSFIVGSLVLVGAAGLRRRIH